jgi:hypothetical protein
LSQQPQESALVTETLLGDPHSPYLTAEEACRYLRRKNVNAFREALIPERIPHRRAGTRLLFVPAELDRWVEEQTIHGRAGESTTSRRGLGSVAQLRRGR